MVESAFIDDLRHAALVLGWSPDLHKSEENPFLACSHIFFFFFDNVKVRIRVEVAEGWVAPTWFHLDRRLADMVG